MAPASKQSVEAWIRSEYKKRYCHKTGQQKYPVNWAKFSKLIHKTKPGHVGSGMVNDILAKLEIEISPNTSEASSSGIQSPKPSPEPDDIRSTSRNPGDEPATTPPPGIVATHTASTNSRGATSNQAAVPDIGENSGGVQLEKSLLDLLLPANRSVDPTNTRSSSLRDLEHAPLISEKAFNAFPNTVQQYGLFGSHNESGATMFHNTNVPFASFICGLQGSGKSHTTACLLENALIRVPASSSNVGRLDNPLSAMVFAYDKFSDDGHGFNISEAASLASPRKDLPKDLCVKKVTVLVSPSNPVIARIYRKLPNVTVIPFKLDARTLGVQTILTLMAVDKTNAVPLYLAQVTKILRDINVEHDGRFDYATFKRRLKLCDFNPAQENMLQLRLDILESFLDLSGTAPQPQFGPGELMIMDMSCPFVDENTACILFKIGLEKYLHSKVAGKMVVLDEAHKYMLNVPGAIELNGELTKTIRLQRHRGVRVVIATQEPTLPRLTDLIPLCDVSIIHRFSSPEWFRALERHVPMTSKDHTVLLKDIELLEPGIALVYAPKAIFAEDKGGNFVKGAGGLEKIRIRERLTLDGGRSIMASTDRSASLNGAYR